MARKRRRRRNASKRRLRRRRHNPARARRRRGGARRRRNPEIIGAVETSARRALSLGGIKANVTTGVQTALGWAGINALARLEDRFGLGRLTGGVGGAGGVVLKYVIKGFNVGLLTGLAKMARLSPRVVSNLAIGGVTNIGVNVINDVAPLIGGPGKAVQGLLSDYVLASNPYSTAMNPFGLSDYLLATGQPSLPYPDDAPVYGGADPYGSF